MNSVHSIQIVDRADHKKDNMGLTSWDGAPAGKIHKYDVSVAKNYLSEFELGQMQRIVSAYLDKQIEGLRSAEPENGLAKESFQAD
jgi:hypothetical protein